MVVITHPLSNTQLTRHTLDILVACLLGVTVDRPSTKMISIIFTQKLYFKLGDSVKLSNEENTSLAFVNALFEAGGGKNGVHTQIRFTG